MSDARIHTVFEINITGDDDFLYVRCKDHPEEIFAFTTTQINELKFSNDNDASTTSWSSLFDLHPDKNLGVSCNE